MYTLVSLYAHECSRKYVRDMMRRVRFWYMHIFVLLCTKVRTRIQCISRSLWLEAIRKLYSKRLAFNPGEIRCWRSAMECWSSYYRRVPDAGWSEKWETDSIACTRVLGIWILNCVLLSNIAQFCRNERGTNVCVYICVKLNCYLSDAQQYYTVTNFRSSCYEEEKWAISSLMKFLKIKRVIDGGQSESYIIYSTVSYIRRSSKCLLILVEWENFQIL